MWKKMQYFAKNCSYKISKCYQEKWRIDPLKL